MNARGSPSGMAGCLEVVRRIGAATLDKPGPVLRAVGSPFRHTMTDMRKRNSLAVAALDVSVAQISNSSEQVCKAWYRISRQKYLACVLLDL